MKVGLSPQEMDSLKLLLMKEREETRVELHHAKNIEVKRCLLAREQSILDMMERFEIPIAV